MDNNPQVEAPGRRGVVVAVWRGRADAAVVVEGYLRSLEVN